MLNIHNFSHLIHKFKQSPYAVPIVLLLLGVALLFLFSGNGKTEDKAVSVDGLDYINTLEKELEKKLGNMQEVESCSVMITVSSVEDREYLENTAVDSSQNEDSEEYSRQKEYLVIESGGEEGVIVKSELMPEICGALVVYEGSGDVDTRKNILEAVSTVLGVRSNQVCIIAN